MSQFVYANHAELVMYSDTLILVWKKKQIEKYPYNQKSVYWCVSTAIHPIKDSGEI
jgi:hypothetical protein